MKFILGKKIGMTQVFDDKTNKVIPVTLVGVEDCVVTQVKTKDTDGYDAVQLGMGQVKKVNKPQAGHLKAFDTFFRFLREFRVANINDFQVGSKLDTTVFALGDKIKVVGVSRGKGFQGAMKRHGFAGGPASHGQKHSKRKVGSIGAIYPQRVIKGKRMAGRDGGIQCTQLGLEVVGINSEKKYLLVKGSVPGNIGGLLRIVSE